MKHEQENANSKNATPREGRSETRQSGSSEAYAQDRPDGIHLEQALEALSNEMLDVVGRAIAASMWGEEQAKTFFEIRTRNVHYSLAVNAARDALVAYLKARAA